MITECRGRCCVNQHAGLARGLHLGSCTRDSAHTTNGSNEYVDEFVIKYRQRLKIRKEDRTFGRIPYVLRADSEHAGNKCFSSPHTAPHLVPHTSQVIYLFSTRYLKMKSAVMAVACAAGAQAFVAPRSVLLLGSTCPPSEEYAVCCVVAVCRLYTFSRQQFLGRMRAVDCSRGRAPCHGHGLLW